MKDRITKDHEGQDTNATRSVAARIAFALFSNPKGAGRLLGGRRKEEE